MRLSSGLANAARDGRPALSILSLAVLLLMAWPGSPKAQSAEDGRPIYERRCSVCHGDRGNGAYWAGNSLVPPPRDFTRADPEALNRVAMIDAVAHGRNGTAMTAWSGRLSPSQVAAVVDFIRAEFMTRRGEVAAAVAPGAAFPGGLVGDAAKGGVFFHANCAECHGHGGDGRGRRAEMNVKKPLDFNAPRTKRAFDRARLFGAISRGVPGTTMPAWSKVLSEQQIADVAEYAYRAFIVGDGVVKVQAAPSVETADAGKPIYLQHCSYCHGQKGDGRTAAAQVLAPKPKDFTGLPRVSFDQVTAAVRKGRAGTAMPSFAKVLTEAQVKAVAKYVTLNLAGRRGETGRYHTVENGWPDHDLRYRPAIPFALGEKAIDAPFSSLTPEQREGLELFKGACVSCHFGRRDALLGGSSGADGHGAANHKPADYEKGVHDIVPDIADLTSTEAEGRRLYQAACAQCHAADGTGAHWIGRFLKPSPTDFNTPAYRVLLSSDAFVVRTLRAPEGTSMPSFESVLSREQAEAIAAYVRRAFQTR